MRDRLIAAGDCDSRVRRVEWVAEAQVTAGDIVRVRLSAYFESAGTQPLVKLSEGDLGVVISTGECRDYRRRDIALVNFPMCGQVWIQTKALDLVQVPA